MRHMCTMTVVTFQRDRRRKNYVSPFNWMEWIKKINLFRHEVFGNILQKVHLSALFSLSIFAIHFLEQVTLDNYRTKNEQITEHTRRNEKMKGKMG